MKFLRKHSSQNLYEDCSALGRSLEWGRRLPNKKKTLNARMRRKRPVEKRRERWEDAVTDNLTRSFENRGVGEHRLKLKQNGAKSLSRLRPIWAIVMQKLTIFSTETIYSAIFHYITSRTQLLQECKRFNLCQKDHNNKILIYV